MAAAVSMPSPRSVTTGAKLPNIPVIEHPRSRMGDGKDLNITGSSGQGEMFGNIRRENTFVAMHDGKVQLGLNRDNLPPLTSRSHLKRERMLTWPPEHLLSPTINEQGAYLRPRKYMNEVWSKKDVTPEELEYVIQQKLLNGRHSLQHLFKSNDPTGQGSISREALMRIIFSLTGYITNSCFNKLLRRLGLWTVKSISFEEFVSCFQKLEGEQNKEWVIPSNPKDIYFTKHNPEEHLREKVAFPRDSFVPASYVAALLKAKASKGELDMKTLLPASCFEPASIVLPPQLRELLAKLGFHLHDEEFKKLWQRFDLEGVGSVKAKHFFKMLHLDVNGSSKQPATFPRKTKLSHSRGLSEEARKELEAEQPSSRPVPKKTRTRYKHLDNILDIARAKLEEPHDQLLVAFEHFDFLANGFVSRVDFRKILKEFGMPVAAIDLEHFLSRCNVRTLRGQVNYKEFLMKYWNRSENGFVFRIVNDPFHLFSKDQPIPADDSEMLSAEELEVKLVQFLHGAFLKIVGHFQDLDKNALGVVTQLEFKHVIEQKLHIRLKERHWEKMKQDIGMESDDLFPYTKFLELIVDSPGSWNKKQENGFCVTKVDRIDTPGEVYKIKAADKEKEAKEAARGRPVEQLLTMLKEEFKTKSHQCDLMFRKSDPKMTGRLDAEQLLKVLNQSGIEIIKPEVDRLFKSFDNIPSDGVYTWTRFLAHIVELDKSKKPEKSVEELKQDNSNNNTNMKGNTPSSAVPEVKITAQGKRQSEVVENLIVEKQGTKTRIRDQLLEKIKEDVTSNWDHLKYIFRHLDPTGSATIPISDMKECVRTFEFSLSDAELEALCERYNLAKDGKFHYMPFMESYTVPAQHKPAQKTDNNKQKPAEQQKETKNIVLTPRSKPENGEPASYDRMSHKLQQRQTSAGSWGTFHPTIDQVIHRVGQKLVKEWKSLRRAFKKSDSDNKGFLTIIDFRKVIESCGVAVTEDDMYHIVAEFDENMNGKICYEEFLHSILKS